MPTPQIEDGYTRIANELLESLLLEKLSKRQLLIVFAVIRKTYGYGKKTDDMTIHQLAKLTGLREEHASRTVSELVDKNILLKRQGQYGYIIGLSKDSRNWKRLPKRQGMPKRQMQPAKTAELICQNGIHKRNSQKKTPKETPLKSPHGEMGHVLLTESEHGKLVEKFTQQGATDRIADADLYFASKGTAGKYKSHYACILNWARKDEKQQQSTLPDFAGMDLDTEMAT